MNKMILYSAFLLVGLTASSLSGCSDKPALKVEYEEPEPTVDPNEDNTPLRENTLTYYFDSAKGSDSGDGLSEAKAWKSLSKLNGVKLLAGDRVLLRRGATFNEVLLVSEAAGTKKQRVTVSTYGTGDKPKIVAPDGSQYAVRLNNCVYTTMEDLDVTNHGSNADLKDRMGVNIHLQDFGRACGTELKGIDIHDINGVLWKGQGAGVAIRFTLSKNSVINYWDGILIEGCTIRRCTRNGVSFSGNYERGHWYPHLNVVIRENLIEDVPGDGIVVDACDGAIVEYNLMRHCTDPWGDQHNASAGMWPWSSDNTIIQFNEVIGQKTTWDAQGFDADYNNLGTTIRYNYSHDNYGGFLLICNDGSAMKTYSAGNGGTRVYGNVSYNDGIRPKQRAKDQKWFSPLIHASGPIEDCVVYNNVLCRTKRAAEVPNQDIRFLVSDSWGGYPKDIEFHSNLFYSEESAASFAASGKGNVVMNGNWYMGLSSSATTSAADKAPKGENALFRKLLDETESTQEALMKGFLREVKTKTATIITVDKDKINQFFK